jgi:hypothetical protein
MTRPTLASLIVPVLLTTACASTDKGAAAGKTVSQAADQITKGITDLDATLASLKGLTASTGPDLPAQFKSFCSNLSSLESTAKDVADLAAKMGARSQEYIAQWDQQIATVQNEDIRERSVDRRQTIAAGFKKIQDEYGEVRDEFKPLLDKLTDVRTALTTDLTLDGVKSIKGTVDDIEDDSDDVKESLQELASKFNELGVKLSRTGPPAAGAPKP